MVSIILTALVTLVTLPILTLLIFALASHLARPGRRLALAGMGVLVIATGEWSLPLGLVSLVSYGIWARHDLWQTWRSARRYWPSWPHPREFLQNGFTVLHSMMTNVLGMKRVGGVRPWLAAQGLRLAIALTPHHWADGIPDMPGMVGVALSLDNIGKRMPSLDEAAHALHGIHPIVNMQNEAPTTEIMAMQG